MKRVFGMVEVVFDIAYMLAATVMGLVLLGRGGGYSGLGGAMALFLVGGDAFHLLPRIRLVLSGREEELRPRLGRGKQITSITMTLFYLLLWELGQLVFPGDVNGWWPALIYGLAAIRIILCLLPQNRWTDRYPPLQWGLLRNIPFFLLGLLTAIRFFLARSQLPGLYWMWLAVALSFAFYLPVVLWSNRYPKIGMLMLPKTCMYLWMLVMVTAI